MVAHHFEGHGFQEIAVIHGIKEAAARKRASRATERLGKMLGGGAAAMKSAGAMTLPALSPKAVATTAMACAPPIALLSFAAIMGSSKVKIAVAAALIALVPFAMQWRRNDLLTGQNATLEARLSILEAPSPPSRRVAVSTPVERPAERGDLVDHLNRALAEARQKNRPMIPENIVEAAGRVGEFKLRTFLLSERYKDSTAAQDEDQYLAYAKELDAVQSEMTQLMLASRYLDQLSNMDAPEVATLLTKIITNSLALDPSQGRAILDATTNAYESAFAENLFLEDSDDNGNFPPGYHERRKEIYEQARSEIVASMDPGTAMIFEEIYESDFIFNLSIGYDLPQLAPPVDLSTSKEGL